MTSNFIFLHFKKVVHDFLVYLHLNVRQVQAEFIPSGLSLDQKKRKNAGVLNKRHIVALVTGLNAFILHGSK